MQKRKDTAFMRDRGMWETENNVLGLWGQQTLISLLNRGVFLRLGSSDS